MSTKNIFNNISFFWLILYSGMGIHHYRSFEGVVILSVLTFIFILVNNIRFDRRIYLAIAIWMIYATAVSIIHSDFRPLFIGKQILHLIAAFSVINHFRVAIFIKYEKIIVSLSLASLFFWVINVFDPATIENIVKVFGIDTYYDRDYFIANAFYKNILVYTYTNLYTMESILPRNYGFCWEPGPFSIFILIAIYFNLARTSLRFSRNYELYILIIAIFTTQSTTGVLGFFALTLYAVYKSRSYKLGRIFAIPTFMALLTIAYIDLPFLGDRVKTQYESSLEIESTISRSLETGRSYSAGRFGGMVIAWQDFKNDPLFGKGGSIEKSYGYLGESQVFIVNGFASILSIYGIFGIIILLIFLRKTSILYNNYFRENLPYAFFIIMSFSYFAFSVHSLFIIYLFTFYSFFPPRSIN